MRARSSQSSCCRLTVGRASCDIRGFTNTHLQAAVDRVAEMGGGEVEISEGSFRMSDGLHLRSGVRVKGQGDATVLRKEPMKSAKIISFLGYGHYDLEVDRPDVFKTGDGVVVRDDHAFGFYTTVATLVRREGDVWFTNRPHNHDYLGVNGGVVESLFPIVEAVDVADAGIEGVRIDGNSRANPVMMNGCRGGGFLALRCQRLRLRGLSIHDYNGDGLGFQTCDDMDVAGCVVEGCTGNGYHPGSGSNRFRMRDCVARANGGCGVFYCLRVRGGVLEDTVCELNAMHGVSIGDRDTGNINRRLTLRRNGGAGIWFRDCQRSNAAHGAVFEHCRVEGNCGKPGVAEAQVVVQGQTEGVQLIHNRIRRRRTSAGIVVKPGVISCELRGNRVLPPGKGAVRDERV